MAARNPAKAVTVAVLAALTLTVTEAVAFDESQYPDWSGQWKRPRGVGTQWDQTKPSGLGQQAPLTTRIPGHSGDKHQGSGHRRSGYRRPCDLRYQRHAAGDDGDLPDRIRDHAQGHLRAF